MHIRSITLDNRSTEGDMSNDTVMFCCGCNRVKDNGDEWSYAYPDDFGKAQIAYGLCPTCMEELYPGYTKENEKTYLKKEHMRPAFA